MALGYARLWQTRLHCGAAISLSVGLLGLAPAAYGQADRVSQLIGWLQDKNRAVRSEAARSLGDAKDPRAVEPLVAALNDKGVRLSAITALGKIGDSRAAEPLIAALKDTDDVVRAYAAQALGRIGDTRAVEPLIAALNDTNSPVAKGHRRVRDPLAR
jgi:HEAT repeat protein